jgi:hypothetical protein
MGAATIGALPLSNGETVWALYGIENMPTLSPPPQAWRPIYMYRNRPALQGRSVGALAFGTEPDGSCVIYDWAEEGRAAASTGQREQQPGGSGLIGQWQRTKGDGK